MNFDEADKGRKRLPCSWMQEKSPHSGECRDKFIIFVDSKIVLNLFQLVASLYKEIASLGTYKTQFSGTVAEALFNRGGSVAWHIIVLRLSHSEMHLSIIQ